MRQHQSPVPPIHTQKPLRPALKRASTTSTAGTLLGSPRRQEHIIIEQSNPEMAACFLQYCAMCEKQITTPNNSILYCSQACQRKDSSKPLSAANIPMATTPPPSAPSSPKQILTPRTPTGVDLPSIRIPPDHHSYKSDLDPTEWKPKLPRVGAAAKHNRYNSEAFRYLSQFHRVTLPVNEKNDIGKDTPYSEITIDVPATYTGTGMINTATSTPALSLGSTAETSSSWSVNSGTAYSHGYNHGYDFSTRPLLPRHNRWYSSSSIGGMGTDLVTPHIPPPVEAYMKKEVTKGGKKEDGLGAIFGGGTY